MLRTLLSKVTTKFSSHPLLCNCLTYGGLYTLSETGQQTIIYKIGNDEPQPYDTGTIARYAVMGTLILPNIMFHWYRWLDRRFPATNVTIIAKKMVLDQCIMSPPTLATFYIGMSVMEGKEDIFNECKQKLLPTWITASAFWLPVQAVNFLLVPAKARLVYVSCCCLLWDNAMCIFKRTKISSESGDGKDGHFTMLGTLGANHSSSEKEVESSPSSETQSSSAIKLKEVDSLGPIRFKEFDFRETIINPSQFHGS